MSGRLFAHYMDSVNRSAGHPERLVRSPSLKRGKKRGYMITVVIFVIALLLLYVGVFKT